MWILCGIHVDKVWIKHKYRRLSVKYGKKLDIFNIIKYNFPIHYKNVTNM